MKHSAFGRVKIFRPVFFFVVRTNYPSGKSSKPAAMIVYWKHHPVAEKIKSFSFTFGYQSQLKHQIFVKGCNTKHVV